MKAYKFLLFDLDNTLLDFNADMTMAFERLYRSQGWDAYRPYSRSMLDLYESCNNKWWKKFERGECAKPELFVNRFVEFLEAAEFPGDPSELNEKYFHFLGQGGVCFPGVREMLKELEKTAEIYIITNGNGATARTRIRNSGLLPLIRNYFVSETIGYAKPDVGYFEYVFSHIPGFERDKALVIGDSPSSDIQGAVNAGVDSLWYHREDVREEVPSTYEASGFGEIVELLRPKAAGHKND